MMRTEDSEINVLDDRASFVDFQIGDFASVDTFVG